MFSWQTKRSMLKALLTKESPFYVQFYFSKHCHLRCKMCSIVEAMEEEKLLSLEQIERIAENLRKIGTGVVLLTGGEPFLRKDIAEIVRIFKSKQMDVRMQTAGIGTRAESLRQCVAHGARDINVSLDSLDEEMSDYINGIKGSWRDAIRTMAAISRIFPQRDSICALGCVLSAYNFEEIEPIVDFATRIGWWVSLVPVHINPPGHKMSFWGFDENFRLRPHQREQLRGLIERLKRRKRQGDLLFDSDDYLDSIVDFMLEGKPSWRANGVCDSPQLYFAILPDGEFAPCNSFRLPSVKPVYLYNEDFPAVYRSREFRKQVCDKVTANCPGCNFGSWPEMTLSVRSWGTLRERIALQGKAARHFRPRLEDDKMFEILQEVRKKYPVYDQPREFSKREVKSMMFTGRDLGKVMSHE